MRTAILLLAFAFLPTPTLPADEEWCDRVAGGPSGTGHPALGLSAAHAGIRFFGVQPYHDADRALAEALGGDGALTHNIGKALESYADRLEGVCAVRSDDRPLVPPRLAWIGETVVIRPGPGQVSLPPAARAVAFDLRDLPDAPGLGMALRAAIQPALATPVPLPDAVVRQHEGMMMEVGTSFDFYRQSVVHLQRGALVPEASVDRPIGLLIGARLPPEAAEIAGALRLARRAWIVGDDVLAPVAESRWQGIGPGEGTGIAFRAMHLTHGDEPWPYRIPADVDTRDTGTFLARLSEFGVPPELPGDLPERPLLAEVSPLRSPGAVPVRSGDVRAALIAAHGAARAFFPYFHDVGDRIDNRLLELLPSVADPDRLDHAGAGRLLGRLGEALHDGHTRAAAFDPDGRRSGWIPILLDEVGGEPVISRSLAPDLHPGDVIEFIDGLPVADWLADVLPRVSAATDGHRRIKALDGMLHLKDRRTLGLRDPDGMRRSVVVSPHPYTEFRKVGGIAFRRAAGSLADLGSPDLYYLNISGEVLPTIEEFRLQLRKAEDSAGLIVDVRGYPGIDHLEPAQRLICGTVRSPLFRVPVLEGPDQRHREEIQYSLEPLDDPRFCGPIVLMVGPRTISATENFATILVDSREVRIVGRQSAGTNGNITNISLPGSLGLSFTGMEVLHADRSRFHGIGLLPDREVLPRAADLRDGYDRTLHEAVAELRRWIAEGRR